LPQHFFLSTEFGFWMLILPEASSVAVLLGEEEEDFCFLPRLMP
jgi:hypothetical protein